nr:MAG TPA: hypothetical protein [Caudoviricetes sp.]
MGRDKRRKTENIREKQRISEKNGEKKRLLFMVVNFQIINI